jgi:hypothetical protein
MEKFNWILWLLGLGLSIYNLCYTINKRVTDTKEVRTAIMQSFKNGYYSSPPQFYRSRFIYDSIAYEREIFE